MGIFQNFSVPFPLQHTPFPSHHHTQHTLVRLKEEETPFLGPWGGEGVASEDSPWSQG